MGAVKTLKALAEIPADKRSKDVTSTIEKGAEHMLKHHIHKRSHDLSHLSKPGWLRFGFPIMYPTDVLEILRILTRHGYKEKTMTWPLKTLKASIHNLFMKINLN